MSEITLIDWLLQTKKSDNDISIVPCFLYQMNVLKYTGVWGLAPGDRRV